MEKAPLFVIGCPRSGTTLLSTLLEPTCYGSPVETHFITKYFKLLPKYGNIKKKQNFFRLIRDILSERPVMQWKINIDIEKFWSELELFEYNEIVDKLCMMFFSEKGKLSWGDKTPHYILEIDIINRLFPKSRYVYIVRDGRDVALSLLRRSWGPNNIYSCASFWRKCNMHTTIIERLFDRGFLLLVKYEELLEKPQTITREIYSFLGERYDPLVVHPIIETFKKSNYDKWKVEFSEMDTELFESIASNTLKRFGYETSYNETKINSGMVLLWKMHDRILYYKHLIKMNTIDALKIKFLGKDPFLE